MPQNYNYSCNSINKDLKFVEGNTYSDQGIHKSRDPQEIRTRRLKMHGLGYSVHLVGKYYTGGNPREGYPEGGYPRGGYPRGGYPEGGYPRRGYPNRYPYKAYRGLSYTWFSNDWLSYKTLFYFFMFSVFYYLSAVYNL